MSTILKALYSSVLHPVDAANFTDDEGDVYRLPSAPRFRHGLGSKVLILDVDSRPLTGEGQIMNESLQWKGMRPLSAGMLSHYMFGTPTALSHATCRVAPTAPADSLTQHRSTGTTTSSSALPTMPTAGAPGSRSP